MAVIPPDILNLNLPGVLLLIGAVMLGLGTLIGAGLIAFLVTMGLWLSFLAVCIWIQED